MLMRCFCWSSRELSIIWRWQICLWRENREPWISSKQHFFNKIHERISNHFFLLARHDSRQTIWKNYLCGKYGDEKIFPLIRMTRHVCKHRMKNVFLNLILSFFFCSWFFFVFYGEKKEFHFTHVSKWANVLPQIQCGGFDEQFFICFGIFPRWKTMQKNLFIKWWDSVYRY